MRHVNGRTIRTKMMPFFTKAKLSGVQNNGYRLGKDPCRTMGGLKTPKSSPKNKISARSLRSLEEWQDKPKFNVLNFGGLFKLKVRVK